MEQVIFFIAVTLISTLADAQSNFSALQKDTHKSVQGVSISSTNTPKPTFTPTPSATPSPTPKRTPTPTKIAYPTKVIYFSTATPTITSNTSSQQTTEGLSNDNYLYKFTREYCTFSSIFQYSFGRCNSNMWGWNV